ncbi:hypothetical protein HDC33_003008 [Sporosarcina sp. JAI121]|nr:hypothetical protein [Sporosarcina sp. JAI121]
MNNYGTMGLKRGVPVIYLTTFYIFVLAVFVSAIGGFMFYKVSCKKLSRTLSYILGGIASLLLSYPMTKLLLLGGVWFFHLPIAVLSIVVYVAFLLNSNGSSKLISWVGIVVLALTISGHVYLIILSIFLK